MALLQSPWHCYNIGTQAVLSPVCERLLLLLSLDREPDEPEPLQLPNLIDLKLLLR